jgi:hypothetical protein
LEPVEDLRLFTISIIKRATLHKCRLVEDISISKTKVFDLPKKAGEPEK